MIKLSHSIELLVRQVAAQSAIDPRDWLEKMLMAEIKKHVSKDAIELAISKGRKHRAARKDASRL
jgi:hypothetical protein